MILTAHFPTALGLCEYWGVDTGCNYDGRHERPTRCKGLGRRYCDRAPEVDECPEACRYEVRGTYCGFYLTSPWIIMLRPILFHLPLSAGAEMHSLSEMTGYIYYL